MRVLKGNLQLANPIIRNQQAFHNTKHLQICRTASDPYKSDRRPLYQTNIEVISEWHIQLDVVDVKMRWQLYIRHGMVDAFWAAESHRPYTRSASDRYQSDIGRYIGTTPEWQYRNYIKMAFLSRFCWCRNTSNSPVSQLFSPSGVQLKQRKFAQTL